MEGSPLFGLDPSSLRVAVYQFGSAAEARSYWDEWPPHVAHPSSINLVEVREEGRTVDEEDLARWAIELPDPPAGAEWDATCLWNADTSFCGAVAVWLLQCATAVEVEFVSDGPVHVDRPEFGAAVTELADLIARRTGCR